MVHHIRQTVKYSFTIKCAESLTFVKNDLTNEADKEKPPEGGCLNLIVYVQSVGEKYSGMRTLPTTMKRKKTTKANTYTSALKSVGFILSLYSGVFL